MGEGFYPQETDGVDYWNWAGEQEAEITFLCADSCQLCIGFFVDCAKMYRNETVQIVLDGKIMGDFKYGDPISLSVDNAVCKKHRLRILAEHAQYKIQTDSRQFAFRVVNLKILQEIKTMGENTICRYIFQAGQN